jgi:glutathione-regulated potassium-efflux system ancillary protein KefG
MNKILIIFAHPRFEKSKTNRALLEKVVGLPEVTLNDLYEQYPDFNIDVNREKELLLSHKIIIWHHPFYMYGAPALLKQWIDLVLEHGWAHGKEGDFLKNKIVFNTITAGGTREVYAAGQYNRFTIRELLAPFEQTANLCKMTYLPPFTVHGTYLLTGQALADNAALYRKLLERMARDDFDLGIIKQFPYLNDWLLADEGKTKL